MDGTQRSFNQACEPFNAVVTPQQNIGQGVYDQCFRDRYVMESVGKWRAATFIVSGLRDLVAPADRSLKLWDALGRSRIPCKLWLTQGGHADPFDLRRASWVDTLHAWFDRYLLHLPTGIDTAAPVTVQNVDLSWRDQASWPTPAAPVLFRFTGGALQPGQPGSAPPQALGKIVATAALRTDMTNDLLDPFYDPAKSPPGA